MNEKTHAIIDLKTTVELNAEIPFYASTGSSGADVKAFLKEDLEIPPGESALIPTGLRFAIPHGYEIQVRPRSGLALKNQITVLNSPGTIDADYRGEVGIILINLGKKEVYTDKDGWTVRTKDGTVSVHFEHDVCVYKNKAAILSDYAPIEKAEHANSNLFPSSSVQLFS